MRLAATCACLFLMPLAFMQSDMPMLKKRLLIFRDHFDQLNSTEKICLLKKVLEFYTLVNEDVWTKKVPEQRICELHDDLVYFEENCLKCEACQEIFRNKTQPKKKGCRGIFESKAKPKKKCYKELNEKKRKRKKNMCRNVSQNKMQSNVTRCTEINQPQKKVCKGMFGGRTQLAECINYNKNMDLNGTAILTCQLSRLKLEKRNRPAKVQERHFFELGIFQRYLRLAAETASGETNYDGR